MCTDVGAVRDVLRSIAAEAVTTSRARTAALRWARSLVHSYSDIAPLDVSAAPHAPLTAVRATHALTHALGWLDGATAATPLPDALVAIEKHTNVPARAIFDDDEPGAALLLVLLHSAAKERDAVAGNWDGAPPQPYAAPSTSPAPPTPRSSDNGGGGGGLKKAVSASSILADLSDLEAQIGVGPRRVRKSVSGYVYVQQESVVVTFNNYVNTHTDAIC